MVFPISGPQGAKATDKTKAKGRVGESTGTSFASLLSAAEQAHEAPAPLPNTALAGLNLPSYLPEAEEEIATDTRGQTAQLLQTLRQLADAALGGAGANPTERLHQLATATATDSAHLTPAQAQVVAEARTRAAVEAEKLKG
jgi:hypothetical protein